MASRVNGIWKEDSCSVSHNCLRERFFNTTQTWIGTFLNTPGVFSADIYFLWAVDAQNKKNEKMKKWDYFESFKNHLNPLPMDKKLHGQSLKH